MDIHIRLRFLWLNGQTSWVRLEDLQLEHPIFESYEYAEQNEFNERNNMITNNIPMRKDDPVKDRKVIEVNDRNSNFNLKINDDNLFIKEKLGNDETEDTNQNIVVIDNMVNVEYQMQHVDDEAQLQGDEVNRDPEPGETLKMLNRDAEPGEILMIQRKEILERTIMQHDVYCEEDTITNVTGMNNGPKVFDPGGRHIEENLSLIHI